VALQRRERQQSTIAIWQRLARQYRNDPTVLGYDLLNEPVPNYPKLGPMNSAVEPLYKRLTPIPLV
jgi:endoglucanase